MTHKLKNLVKAQQLTPSVISELSRSADRLRKKGAEPLLKGIVQAVLFYEPSTRTRLSFEAAMIKLGGRNITSENAREFSSAAKGEKLEDTIRIVSAYSDCIVLRHYEEGASERAAEISSVPIINAGDGQGQHPTQALLDVYTIKRELGRLEDFKIAMVGDLAHGRTVRSLSYVLGKYDNIDITFVSPESLRMRDDIKGYLKKHRVGFREEKNLTAVLPEVDIVYMTRIQKERMAQDEYEKTNGCYVLNVDNLELVRGEARIMHPLPHTDEIDLPAEVEQEDSRVAYFRQAENGLYIRMALLKHLLHD